MLSLISVGLGWTRRTGWLTPWWTVLVTYGNAQSYLSVCRSGMDQEDRLTNPLVDCLNNLWHCSVLSLCCRSGMDQEDRLTNPLVDCLGTLRHLKLDAWREVTPTAQACDVSIWQKTMCKIAVANWIRYGFDSHCHLPCMLINLRIAEAPWAT